MRTERKEASNERDEVFCARSTLTEVSELGERERKRNLNWNTLEDRQDLGGALHEFGDRPKCIEQFTLQPSFSDHDDDVNLWGGDCTRLAKQYCLSGDFYLFRSSKSLHDIGKVLLDHTLRVAGETFDVALEIALKQNVHLTVVVVVVPHAIDALNVIPNGTSKGRRVDVGLGAQSVCNTSNQSVNRIGDWTLC